MASTTTLASAHMVIPAPIVNCPSPYVTKILAKTEALVPTRPRPMVTLLVTANLGGLGIIAKNSWIGVGSHPAKMVHAARKGEQLTNVIA